MFTKRGNKPRVPSSIPVTSYVQRLALCSSHLANISVSVKQVRVEKRSQKWPLLFSTVLRFENVFVKENPKKKRELKQIHFQQKICFASKAEIMQHISMNGEYFSSLLAWNFSQKNDHIITITIIILFNLTLNTNF